MWLNVETLGRKNAMALGEGAHASAADAWDDDTWDDLLAYIESGVVVPIIGPACYPVEIDGRRLPLDLHVAERLALKLGLRTAPTPPGETLNEVVLAYLRADGDRRRLYRFVHEIVQEMELAPPPMPKQLAEIRQFNLFVTTGFDTMLETALDQVRFGGVPQMQSIAYAPNNKQDLPQGIEDGSATVYHLFGKVSPLPNSYAISDEDLLEFLTALQSDTRRPENLFNRLKSEHVLLIGAHFPDWVARMFLRTTKGRRLSESRDELEFLAEENASCEPSLVAFLTHFSKPTRLYDGDLGQFVETLWRRWRDRQQTGTAAGKDRWAPRAAEMPADAIFISYAREDLVAVRALTDAFEAAGLSVWFDMNRLNAGDSFDLKIEQNIRRCSLFIPVLSRNTQARTQGFFRKEWRYALARDMEIDPRQPFIVPVVIDDSVDIETLLPRFREINVAEASEGRPSAELVAQLKAIAGR
jgi:hypothetical protein